MNEPQTEHRFCEDCRWYRRRRLSADKCSSPHVFLNAVRRTDALRDCRRERSGPSHDSSCGTAALYWEPPA